MSKLQEVQFKRTQYLVDQGARKANPDTVRNKLETAIATLNAADMRRDCQSAR